ncbi:MAG: type II toxin-antitoxin system VapC family toxin [Desulfohalobiaceae bacterium]|nr:type II toxin-antitoxin system VapC family toxin [Desulfohalobiaceae bacterium]
MIGLDTNVLVRYLTQDDPEQALRASRLIEAQCTREVPCRIALIVLCELVWVLRGAYGYEKALIIQVLEGILASSELRVENEDAARSALAAFRNGPADFADYVIACANRAAGCDTTYSLDRKLAQHPYARQL